MTTTRIYRYKVTRVFSWSKYFFFFFICLVFIFLDGFHLFIEIQHPDRDKTPWFSHSFGLIIIIADTRKPQPCLGRLGITKQDSMN